MSLSGCQLAATSPLIWKWDVDSCDRSRGSRPPPAPKDALVAFNGNAVSSVARAALLPLPFATDNYRISAALYLAAGLVFQSVGYRAAAPFRIHVHPLGSVLLQPSNALTNQVMRYGAACGRPARDKHTTSDSCLAPYRM